VADPGFPNGGRGRRQVLSAQGASIEAPREVARLWGGVSHTHITHCKISTSWLSVIAQAIIAYRQYKRPQRTYNLPLVDYSNNSTFVHSSLSWLSG